MRPIIRGALLASSFASISLGILPYLFLPLGPFDGLVRLTGAPLITIGAILSSYVVWKFAFAGHGTPAPFDPPKLLITGGLYGKVRNPMYLGAVSIALGEGLLFGSLGVLVYAGLMWTFLHLFVVNYEEPRLRTRYGRPYEEYCLRTGRWVPRL